jgi:hypothetical protein
VRDVEHAPICRVQYSDRPVEEFVGQALLRGSERIVQFVLTGACLPDRFTERRQIIGVKRGAQAIGQTIDE